jgi:hypothetical protein
MGFFLGFSYGLAKLLLCILSVYFGAPYAFLMKFFYLFKKKNMNLDLNDNIIIV